MMWRWACLLLPWVVACSKHAPPQPAPGAVLEGFLEPADARAWYLRMLVSEAQGDRVEADRAAGWIRRVDRRTAEGAAAIGLYHARQGRWSEAVMALDEAVLRNPSVGHAAYATALEARGEAEAAAVHRLQAQP
jgi:hypothetical protein